MSHDRWIGALTVTMRVQAKGDPPHFFPEVEVIKLNSAKIYRFLQLLSHSRGFFARVEIFKSLGSSPYRFLG
jgi:hypothetical protein